MRTEKPRPSLRFQLLAVAAERFREVERCVARPPGVILVGDGRAEERHDAVAGVLVHGPLEAVHALGEELEEAVEDAVPLLGIELLGEVHRALHIGETGTVTCLRSPSRAAREPRIFSARCLGVVVARGPRRLCGGRRRGQARSALLAEVWRRPRFAWPQGRGSASCSRTPRGPDGRSALVLRAARVESTQRATRLRLHRRARRRLMALRHGSLEGVFTLADASLGRRPRPRRPSGGLPRRSIAAGRPSISRRRSASGPSRTRTRPRTTGPSSPGCAPSSRGPIRRFTVRSSASS